MKSAKQKVMLEDLYERINRREFVSPDPLQFLYHYREIRDREIVGLVASSLAYGRVAQILNSVSWVLEIMGESPYSFLLNETDKTLLKKFSGFKHRFATGEHISGLLLGMKKTIEGFNSLNQCFKKGFSAADENIIPGMTFFVENITQSKYSPGHLIPMPNKGSACKRMNLFLRWMVRKDKVDPGGWTGIPISKLVIPLDTHMHKIGVLLDFTKRKQANMITAFEITRGFYKIAPQDPVKYDFSLTRLGIRDDMDIGDFFKPNLMAS